METQITYGYHIREIAKGELGEISKIQEELDELSDAAMQQSKIMMLVELSDMLGAVDAYLTKHFPGFTLKDLESMAMITKRVFVNGHRS